MGIWCTPMRCDQRALTTRLKTILTDRSFIGEQVSLPVAWACGPNCALSAACGTALPLLESRDVIRFRAK